MLSLPYWVPIVAIRVSPEVEEGFADRFMKDMRRRLDIGHFIYRRYVRMTK